jgi:hypothetical protein
MQLIDRFLKETNSFVVIAIPTGSEKQLIEVKPIEKEFTLEEVKTALKMKENEYVEMVTCNEDWMFLCDEEGKLKEQPINYVATEIWNKFCIERSGHKSGDFLVGNVIFMKRNLLS